MSKELTKQIVGEYLSSCDQALLGGVNMPDPDNPKPNDTVRFLPKGSTRHAHLNTMEVAEFIHSHEISASGRRQITMRRKDIAKLEKDPEWGFQLKENLDLLGSRKLAR